MTTKPPSARSITRGAYWSLAVSVLTTNSEPPTPAVEKIRPVMPYPEPSPDPPEVLAAHTNTMAPSLSCATSGSCWVEEVFCSTWISPVSGLTSAAPAMSTGAPWSSNRRAVRPLSAFSYHTATKPPSDSASIRT